MSVWAQMEPLTSPALNGRGKSGAAKAWSHSHSCLLSMQTYRRGHFPFFRLVAGVASFVL